MLGLITCGSVAFQACSSDSGKSSAGNEAGAAGETGTGAAQNGQAGSPGEAGAIGAGGESGGGGFVFPDALDPISVVVPGAEPAKWTQLLVSGTDFVTTKKTQVVNVTLAPALVSAATILADSDVTLASSAGLGFAIEHTNDKVDLFDGAKVKTSFDLTDPGTPDAAPVTNKAYVSLLNQSLIAILDLDAGKVSSRIDLSEFNDPSDSDHSADVGQGVYDAKKKVVYYSLARIDRNAIAADPAFHLPCSQETGLIVGIDTTTDSVVDLNGPAAGKGIELSLVSQSSIALSADGKSLVVLSAGCYEGATLKNQGVEVVDLEAGTTQAVYTPKGDDYLAKLIVTSGTDAVLGTFDSNFAGHWYKLDLSAGTLGDELMDVPGGVSFDGKDLLGVGTGGAIVRYTIATGAVANVSDASVGADYSSAYSTALVQ
ncbi:MAG TPA: hypothetical protein VGL19_00405 [Polyangiaceae bacterium]